MKPKKQGNAKSNPHSKTGGAALEGNQKPAKQSFKKLSEYGKQLAEKQRVKHMYGMREKQFRNLFEKAKHSDAATGAALLLLLERRLDNVVYRMKLAISRKQARQMVVHGHVLVNGRKASSPSMLLRVDDVVQLCQKSIDNHSLMKDVVEKGISTGYKVPEWIDFDKAHYTAKIIKLPERANIQATINESFIVELYSK